MYSFIFYIGLMRKVSMTFKVLRQKAVECLLLNRNVKTLIRDYFEVPYLLKLNISTAN